MYEQFDEPARAAVAIAQDEARALGHGRVGTEHLLLGVLRARGGRAADVLHGLGVDHQAALAHVMRIEGMAEAPPAGDLPLTARSQEALELAMREAYELRADAVGTEHVLLGLLDERAGLAVRVLADTGLTPEGVRAELLTGVASGAAPSGGPAGSQGREDEASPIPNLALDRRQGPLASTPAARRVLELANDEALARGDSAMGPEHLLVALARCEDPVAASILHALGTDAERLRAEVARLRGG